MLNAQNQQVIAHIEEVIKPSGGRESLIVESWQRCTSTHQLDPTILQKAVVLSSSELRGHQDEMEDLTHVARMGMEALYRQIHQIGYVVLLTNEAGITVDFIGDRTFDDQLRQSGLYLGADWNEEHAGTCAVGTCIEASQPITVHQTDHFDATHMALTCSAAPIYAHNGQLAGVLDISALCSPRNKESQYMALKMVQIYAERIECSHFLNHFKDELVFSFSPSPDFVDVAPDYLLATDSAGIIIGFNQRMRRNLAGQQAILGQAIDRFFDADLDHILEMQHLPGYQRLVRTRAQQQSLFVRVRVPPKSTPAKLPQQQALPLEEIHGGDTGLQSITQRLLPLINSRVNIILSGETGTGKEFLTRRIHQSSARADKPFIAINCAAIPESLIESELFGYEYGAFTGSKRGGQVGLIEQANGGTLFLDEIGDMPLVLQSRLLRVLAERELYPLGSTKKITLDLHVISATHQDLKTLIAKGLFRTDLYYRLSGAEFVLPPLRMRDDFNWLVDRLLSELQEAKAVSVMLDMSVRQHLRRYPWPGNIRELKNILEYLIAIKPGQVISVEDLPPDLLSESLATNQPLANHGTLPGAQKIVERQVNDEGASENKPESMESAQLVIQLKQHQWNISATAKTLGVSRMTVYRRMKRHQIVLPNQMHS